MTYRGRVKNGVVVLDGPARPPDGAEVSVRLLKPARRRRSARGPKTLYERMKPFIGIASDLPPDFSANHDHYLYGTPKRQ
jgi:hypothetical protein